MASSAVVVASSNPATTPFTDLLHLPPETLCNIFSQSRREDMYHASLACRDLTVFVDDQGVWKSLFTRDFPERLLTVGLPGTPWKVLYHKPVAIRANMKKKIAHTIPLAGHPASVTTLGCHGTFLVSGDVDGNIKVRKKGGQGNFEEVQVLSPCLGGVFQLEQDYLLFPSQNTLKIYKLSPSGTFEEIQTLDVDGDPVVYFKMGKNELTVSTTSNTVIYQKGADGLFQESNRFADCGLALVKGDYLFAVGAVAVQVWKRDANGVFQNQRTDLTVTPSDVRPSWISFKNGHLILADFEGTIQIWKQEKNGFFSGPTLHEIGAFQNMVSYVEVQGDSIFAGLTKGDLVILKKEASGVFKVHSKKEHTDRITGLSFYGNYLVSGSVDGTFKIWEQNEEGNYGLLQTVTDPQLDQPITNVVMMEEGKLLLSYATGDVKIWDFSPTTQ